MRLYFDYAASTPVDPLVECAMRPYFLEKFGNAGSLHSFGQEAMTAIDRSRETIAEALGADFREIIFTGSATEANNLALRGVIKSFKRRTTGVSRPRLVVSSIEHEAVLETARDMEKDGAEVVYVAVNKEGVVDLKKLADALNERTILVSVMYANNEIGTIEPMQEVSKLISEFRKRKIENRSKKNSKSYFLNSNFYPLFHTDAVQAFQFLDCNVKKLGVDPHTKRASTPSAADFNNARYGVGVDLLTISAHKIYGPKGIGALYVRQETGDKRQGLRGSMSHVAGCLSPIVTGGGQEFGMRSGTENVPLVVGFAEAVRLLAKSRERDSERIAKLRDFLWRGIKKVFPKAELNGPASGSSRLPNILNVCFTGHRSEDLLVKFDLAGLAVSAGSACRGRANRPSHVISALGYPRERALGSIRFSLGRPTTKKEVDAALKIIKMSLTR
jgi:cysteine desulfurase